MIRQVLVSFFLLVSLSGSSQPRRLRDPANWQAQRDSLARLFYQQPAYVHVKYYRNTHRLPWTRAMTLSVLQQGHWVALQPVTGSTFLFPPLQGDSLLLGFTYARQPRIVYTLHGRDMGHGATFTFGIIQRKLLTEKARSEAEWDPIGEVLQPLQLADWRKAKGLRGLRYFKVVPRVYGDGPVFTTTTPIFRRGYSIAP